MAAEQQDTILNTILQKYYQLFSDTNEAAFYRVSAQLKDYYLKGNVKDNYYNVWMNEVLYDTEHGKIYRAIKKCNNMLEEMKEKNDNHYHVVYSALGNIYDVRGNYRLSKNYYQRALKACHPKDTLSLVSIYSRIASLQAHREPHKAWENNEHAGKLAKKYPHYQKIYIVLKGEIAFYLNDAQRFDKAYQQYLQICKENPQLDSYGKDLMGMAYAAFHGDYDKALEILNRKSIDFEDLDRCDMRIQVYEMMGNREKALQVVTYRRDLRDSLNSDMIFDNINEINAEIGISKMKEESSKKEAEAAKRQTLLLITTIVLLVAALGLLLSRNFMRRRMQKQLMKKNKELEVALMRAEESDRMKDSFIEHVSHEIRTPLNIITGFTQVITNPAFKLKDDERNKMLNDININTIEITNIVNELLEVAEEDSKQHYQKDDIINVNALCSRMLQQAEKENKGKLEMRFSTELSDDFTIRSNRRAVEKIMEQLLSNAMKFTTEGYIALKVEDSPDHDVVRFIIEDTGIGIADEYHEQVFERFYKVDTFKQGFGLGLTISRKMAILLGGGIRIDKDYTDGARFFFILPV